MAPQRRGPASTATRRSHVQQQQQQQQQQQSQSTQAGIQRFFSNKTSRTRIPTPIPSIPSTAPVQESASLSLTPPQGKIMEPPPPIDNQHQDKRLRISPGMLIPQSQDDGGGDQVVWRMSPTADRLHEVNVVENTLQMLSSNVSSSNLTAGRVPHQILKKTSMGIPSMTQPNKKRSPSLFGKLEQWLSTAEKTVPKNSTMQSYQVSESRHQTPASKDKENDISAANLSGMPVDLNSQRPSQNAGNIFSSSCRPSLIVKSQIKKSAKQNGSGKRRKALLELLDQVQNVISDPESVSSPADSNFEENDKENANYAIPLVACKSTKEWRTKDNESGSVDSFSMVLDVSAKGPPCSPLVDEKKPRNGHVGDLKYGATNMVPEHANFPCSATEASDMPAAIPEALANIHFLVLEVADITEKGNGQISHKKVLRLLNEYSGVERILYLSDEWFYSIVKPGDTVNVIGEFDSEGTCSVDRNRNLLVVHPDILISGSKVGSSFSCPRRAVLDERIRASSVAFPALLGTMMHELFQFGLVNKRTNRATMEKEAEKLVRRYLDSLFACGGTEKEALEKLKDCIPSIMNWLNCFLHASPSAMPKVDFGRNHGHLPVTVSEVVDIEEMIYSPKFGLKGMIDATLLVNFGNMNIGAKNKILPFEFKTGKLTTGQAAVEHRAQVILYSLLMSDRYSDSIDSGLLYYLQPNQTQGVAIQHADLVGLVMKRNEMATNLLVASSTQQLPPMLQNMHACQRCWHLDVCSIYHKAQEGGTAETSGLGDLFNENTKHLSDSHVGFLKLWDRLIDLEAQELQASRREIWRLPAHEREAAGSCLSCMRVKVQDNEKQGKDSVFIYSFYRDISSTSVNKKNISQSKGLHEQSFSCGDHVLLSTENGHIAVAAGSICSIAVDCVTIKLSHQLRLPQSDGLSAIEMLEKQIWRIDKDETASFLATMRFNVLQLFLKSDGHEHGRRLIVDLEPPRFDSGGIFSQDPASLYVRSTPDLNDDQRRAIFKILSARDYSLILGMPGTGKTSTIVHAVKALLTRGSSILLTSYTNSAVDNILLKLKQQGIDFVRLGRENAIHPELKEHVVEGSSISTVEELDRRMNEVHVVAATCLGITHPLLTNRKFDVCIVDEAGQITLPVCLGPLRFAKSFVLVGDHYQLPPLVRNSEAREKGLAVSLFRRLSEAHPQAIAALQCQYRMNASIMSLCNTLIYGNRLRCGSSEVANGRLVFSDKSTQHSPIWLQKAIDADKPVVFLNTDILTANEARKTVTHNPIEASIVIMIVRQLLKAGMNAKDIGIISPYNYQVQHIRRLLAPDGLDSLEVHTIDRYQGRDKDCVIVSFVKSTSQKSSSTLLADWHRINVAITRAKKKLILIGSKRTLSSTPVLKLLVEQVSRIGGLMDMPEGSRFALEGLTQCTNN